jgi:hypothetical protein
MIADTASHIISTMFRLHERGALKGNADEYSL